MSVSSEVGRISQAKSDIAQAIAEKGVTVPPRAKIDDLADLVRAIKTVDEDDVFLLAHPIGSIYRSTKPQSPSQYGGTWKQVPSMGAYAWERTA